MEVAYDHLLEGGDKPDHALLGCVSCDWPPLLNGARVRGGPSHLALSLAAHKLRQFSSLPYFTHATQLLGLPYADSPSVESCQGLGNQLVTKSIISLDGPGTHPCGLGRVLEMKGSSWGDPIGPFTARDGLGQLVPPGHSFLDGQVRSLDILPQEHLPSHLIIAHHHTTHDGPTRSVLLCCTKPPTTTYHPVAPSLSLWHLPDYWRLQHTHTREALIERLHKGIILHLLSTDRI